MRQLFIFLSLFSATILFANNSFAQQAFEAPRNIELNTKEDYSKYEKAVIDAAIWLEQTDLNKEVDKRQEVNAFIVQWISGSPTVNIELTESLSKIYGKNAQLLAIYMASYARNILENKSTANKFTATKAALNSIMNVYKKRIEISKSKEMDKIIKLTDSELDSYIADKFK